MRMRRVLVSSAFLALLLASPQATTPIMADEEQSERRPLKVLLKELKDAVEAANDEGVAQALAGLREHGGTKGDPQRVVREIVHVSRRP